ncbi:MAG: DUF6148 family protein [Oscillospiraceae bacterium]|nr:DUF6148 family protein [Oscillospiraceae bacterium]
MVACNFDDKKARLEFWTDALQKMREAYLALLEGRVKSYTIGDRQLTRLDLRDLLNKIKEAEEIVDELTLCGQKPRRAFAVVPRDW